MHSEQSPVLDSNYKKYFGIYLAYLFKNNTLGMGSSSERIGLPAGSQVSFLVVQISPSLDTTIFDVLAGSPDTSGLTHGQVGEVETITGPNSLTQRAEKKI